MCSINYSAKLNILTNISLNTLDARLLQSLLYMYSVLYWQHLDNGDFTNKMKTFYLNKLVNRRLLLNCLIVTVVVELL